MVSVWTLTTLAPYGVALSHSQIEALNGRPVPREDNSILVDLGMIRTNIGRTMVDPHA
jgi:hypothetical protein